MKIKSIIISGLFLVINITGIPQGVSQSLSFSEPVPLKNVNSEVEESKPIVSADGKRLYFVRTFHEQNTGGILGGQDIWVSQKKQTGEWGLPQNDFPYLNNEGNNAVVGVGGEGQKLYLLNSYKGKNSKRAGISFTMKKDDGWQEPEALNIPSISGENHSFYDLWMVPEGNILIVSLENEQSLGKEDLFVSLKNENNQKWSPLIHLGDQINSRGYEIAPFLNTTADTLFFASNGFSGQGGCDIFYAVRQDDSWRNWSEPVNLGADINSEGFDAYFFMTKNKEIYFVSDRQNKATDIYHSRVISEGEKQQEQVASLQGEGSQNDPVLNSEEQALIDETQALIEETESLLNEYRMVQEEGQWIEDSLDNLENQERLNAGNIYFAMDEYQLSDTARVILNEIVRNLNNNPSIRIEIIGHADDTGSEEYNLRLSVQRARAVKDYLMNHGIGENRVSTSGRGEKEPLVTNNPVEGMAKNRRVEINYLTPEE